MEKHDQEDKYKQQNDDTNSPQTKTFKLKSSFKEHFGNAFKRAPFKFGTRRP